MYEKIYLLLFYLIVKKNVYLNYKTKNFLLKFYKTNLKTCFPRFYIFKTNKLCS